MISTITVFTVTISCNYIVMVKDNHTFNNFYLAPGMTSTVKGVIFNLVHFIYVDIRSCKDLYSSSTIQILGSCYYKPKCLYRHTSFPSRYPHKFSFPSRTQKCFMYYVIFVIIQHVQR